MDRRSRSRRSRSKRSRSWRSRSRGPRVGRCLKNIFDIEGLDLVPDGRGEDVADLPEHEYEQMMRMIQSSGRAPEGPISWAIGVRGGKLRGSFTTTLANSTDKDLDAIAELELDFVKTHAALLGLPVPETFVKVHVEADARKRREQLDAQRWEAQRASARRRQGVLVAYDIDPTPTPIGFVTFRGVEGKVSASRTEHLEITKLMVQNGQQEAGVGSVLLIGLLQFSRTELAQLDLKEWILGVHARNNKARSFYSGIGFGKPKDDHVSKSSSAWLQLHLDLQAVLPDGRTGRERLITALYNRLQSVCFGPMIV